MDAIFYYVDGKPFKGLWFNLEDINSQDDILEALADHNLIPRDEEGNPSYGGDLLVAETDDELANAFYQGNGIFDLNGYLEVRDCDIENDVAAAFISLFSEWDYQKCKDNYLGRFNSPEDYAQDYIDSTGMFSGIPDSLTAYFDIERFARDIMICNVCESNDHYFNNW